MKRVVVTGIGAITPLAVGAEDSWKNIINNKSGAGPVTYFDKERFPSKVACEISSDFVLEDWANKKDLRKLDKVSIYGIAAAKLAFDDCGFRPTTDEERNRTGTVVSSGIGGIYSTEEGCNDLLKKNRVSPFLTTKLLVNMVAGQISISENLRGPVLCPVTACASSANAIGDAMELIKRDIVDVAAAGGSEASITPLSFASFCACRAVSTSFNDTPEKASRPFDANRDGFVMGEGAVTLILESDEHAKARGAKIYAEVVGYGMSGDAYHITSPEPTGDGAYRSIMSALKSADLKSSEISYINAHGTSTPAGDKIEIKAIERAFGSNNNLAVSSTKSATGHLLGAAGAIEAMISILALRDSKIPPTLNLDNCDIETDLNLVPKTSQDKTLNYVMSNSFGFGGTNASLIFTHYQ